MITKVSLFFSKRKLKAFYGKWVEALYSYDIEVWDKCEKGTKLEKNKTPTPEHATPINDVRLLYYRCYFTWLSQGK